MKKRIIPQSGHIYWQWPYSAKPLHLRDMTFRLGPYGMNWWGDDDRIFAFNEADVEYMTPAQIRRDAYWPVSQYGRCWSSRRVQR